MNDLRCRAQEETIGTLNFAKRAKTIKNKVKVNEEKSTAELNAIINQLKKENSGLQKYALGLESALREAGIDPASVEVRSHPEPQINMTAWVLCMSWCADFECRLTWRELLGLRYLRAAVGPRPR